MRNEKRGFKLITEIGNCLLPTFSKYNREQSKVYFYGFPNKKVYAIYYNLNNLYSLIECNDLSYNYDLERLSIKTNGDYQVVTNFNDYLQWYLRNERNILKNSFSFEEAKEYLSSLAEEE